MHMHKQSETTFCRNSGHAVSEGGLNHTCPCLGGTAVIPGERSSNRPSVRTIRKNGALSEGNGRAATLPFPNNLQDLDTTMSLGSVRFDMSCRD